MSIRKVVLVIGLVASMAATCAEESNFKIDGTSIRVSQDSSEVLCSRCTFKSAAAVTTGFKAARISLSRETGTIYLDGEVRVTLQGGKELRAEHVTVNTDANGVQVLSGDEFQIVGATTL